MEHITSFILGTGFGLLIAFIHGFLKRAGADCYDFIKGKIILSEPDPIEVDRIFEPDKQFSGHCAWVGEEKLTTCLDNGYSYYKGNDGRSRYFRYSSPARNHIEFLMHKP